ncbi:MULTISPECIES: acyl-CoA thioesterase [Actinomadura]|uniref:Thioesterase superfamily protein n=2 Tax=Actinomadura TaxID=1988 RepID=A0A7D3VSI5_ACTVE|nr:MULTISPECIES: thioesterase family protein [Actinomadura]MBO2462003.1 acyl-CoA thioesterase [Actinomadura violacea]QKG21490.1 thioesterase superfamily protein [Actinomadura verrucosospora]
MQQTDLPAAEYRHVYEFNIRFGDIDSQGHVNNVKFLGYLEDARLEMFHGDPVRKGEQPVRGMVISRHEIDYRLPLLPTVYPIRVETWVTEARAASFKLAYEVRDDENVYATATSTLVAFDVEANRLRRFTPEEREFIGRYVVPAE